MNKELQEIKPGYGLGILKFGMTKEEVKSLLGEPDDVEVFSYAENGCERTESWEYHDLDLSLDFDEEENWRLLMISVYSDFYQLNGQGLVGLQREDLLKQVKQMKITDLEFEDWSSEENQDHKLIEAESISISFWLSDGILDEIQWSPSLVDDDTIKWPD